MTITRLHPPRAVIPGRQHQPGAGVAGVGPDWQQVADNSVPVRKARSLGKLANGSSAPIQRFIQITNPHNPKAKENGKPPKGKILIDGKFEPFDKGLWSLGIAYRATLFGRIFGMEEDEVPEPEIRKKGGTLTLFFDDTAAATFRLGERTDKSRQGKSMWLLHMQTGTKYQGRGYGEMLMRRAVREFGQFRVGTEVNMGFFQPEDPKDEIGLTDEGDGFVGAMLAKAYLTHDQVFPNDHREELKEFMSK